MAQWTQIEIDLSKLLGPVNDIIAAIDSVLSFLITVLNIVNAILEVVKVFLIGLLDPIRAIVEAIIAEIRQIIQDLKQLGVYITGDWALFTPDNNFADLVGGYEGYERRMIARLMDTSDPGRPNFSGSSAVVAAFFYASGDISRILKVVQAILRFFGQGSLLGKASPVATLPTPEVLYGGAGQFKSSFKTLSGALQEDPYLPDAITLTWGLPSSAGAKSLFPPLPKGFLIHVSTIPDGFEVLSAMPNTETSPNTTSPQPRIAYGIDPITNGPLKLYGGIADLQTDSPDYSNVELNNPQAPLLLLKLDQNTPLIKPSSLAPLGSALVADTLYADAPSVVFKGGAGTKYTVKIPRSMLPKGASFSKGDDGFAVVSEIPDPPTYYFRVRALTKEVSDEISTVVRGTLNAPVSVQGLWSLYNIPKADLVINKKTELVPQTTGLRSSNNTDFKGVAKASGAAIATFPSAVAAQYIEAVATAILLGILARADMSPAKTGAGGNPVFEKNTYPPGGELGIEDGVRGFLTRYGVGPSFFRGSNTQRFRKRCLVLLGRIQQDLSREQSVPDILAAAIIEQEDVKALLEYEPYPGLTVMGLVEDQSPTSGLGPNPFSQGTAASPKQIRLGYLGGGAGPARPPGFLKKSDSTLWVPDDGSADDSPILFGDGDPVFFRNRVLDTGEQALRGAAAVLQVAGARKTLNDTNWITVRVIPQGVPQLEQVLDKIDAFMQKILDALQGGLDALIKIIEAIQARIYQLQALLELIRALLQSLQLFKIGPFAGTVFVTSGTAGVVTSLVTAENKPQDSGAAYGAGIAVVAGGIPTVLLETIALLLGRSEE